MKHKDIGLYWEQKNYMTVFCLKNVTSLYYLQRTLLVRNQIFQTLFKRSVGKRKPGFNDSYIIYSATVK